MYIEVTISTQSLQLFTDSGELLFSSFISSARKGTGNLQDSYQTPLGRHIIRARIGKDVPVNGVFVARRFTGEIYNSQLAQQYPQRDWILTRILWLSGLEKGKHRLGAVDTMARYIYVHGCPDEQPVGVPVSHGCIRMRHHDLLQLFDQVVVGTLVIIRL